MPPVAHIDFETRSAVNLTKVGVHRYAEDPTTSIICMSWRIDDGPVHRWLTPSFETTPLELYAHIAGGRVALDFGESAEAVIAHNAAFERTMWNQFLPLKLHIEQQDCTLARAAALGLPLDLDRLSLAVKAGETKDKEGYRLMMKMCKPRTLEPLTWHEDEADVERLGRYCDQDVRAECAVDSRLPPLSERERRVWELDQRINDRGVAIDLPAVRRAVALSEVARKAADRRMWELTEGVVSTVNQVAKIQDWLNARGIACDSVKADDHAELITDAKLFDDETAVQVVELRGSAAKAFKFPAMLASVCRDGRIYDSLQYHATVQGRWAGRNVQFHNMKRVDDEDEEMLVARTLDVLHCDMSPQDALAFLDMIDVPPLEALSLCSRAMIVAPPGRRLYGGDFTNIEGRINAWLAGEHWKVRAFEAYDRGEGPDMYKVTAGRILGIDAEAVTKPQRQEQGKVPELACGYQGGLGAFMKMGMKYGVRMPEKRIMQIVRGWREENPMIVQSWADLQQAALDAMAHPGMVVPCLNGRIHYVLDGDFLRCRLPSMRVISYPSPSVEWKTKQLTIGGEKVELAGYGVSYWTRKGGGWLKHDLYGGAQCAHVVSGIARDVLVEGLFNLEEAGYETVLTIHDEGLSETDAMFGDPEEYRQLLVKPIEWMEGCPITAKAWTGDRYVK